MLVGLTQGGKTTVWKTLADAKTSMAKQNQLEQLKVVTHILNPKTLSLNELYGAYDLTTMEWADGVLATFSERAHTTRPRERIGFSWMALWTPSGLRA